MNLLSELFPKARADILRQLFENPSKELHLRDLARAAGLAPASLQRELGKLAEIELIIPRRDGNRLYFRANSDHPLYPELHGIVIKTTGIAYGLGQALKPFEGIEAAFIFGSTASGESVSRSDVDLLVLGSIGLRKLSPALRGLAEKFGREINPVCLTSAEWLTKKSTGDVFVSRLIAEPKLWLKGGPDALAAMGD
jgi:predicted nucleotidyltransferase